MKRNWLLYLVIFSLALNIGTIGVLVYGRWQHPPTTSPPDRPGHGFLRLLHSLQLDSQQQELLKQIYPGHRQQINALRQQIALERQRLIEIFSESAPPVGEIANQITVINNLQNALEQELARFLVEFKQCLRPEQQELLLQQVRRRLCDPRFCRPPGEPHRGRGSGGPRPDSEPR
ncbi:MAG: Spy/CpxP family protein refolding chaperone [Desulfobacca sp.]|uniref:Spy/CpxP family protein refolding chaperone n=1 Tax=Desulfobacca sp. TaxID=2067990 RepID=UPI00404916C2